MTDEQKKERKPSSGHGWFILTQERDGAGMIEAAGPFDNLQAAEKKFRETATTFEDQTVLIAKIQRKFKVKVETVKMVKFE